MPFLNLKVSKWTLTNNVLPRRRDLLSCNYSSSIAKFEFSSKPDLAIVFLKNNGFSDSDISKITRSVPTLLRCSVDKTLKPKFDFLKSQGITGSDLAKVVCSAPSVLTNSLEKKIIPCFDLIRSIVHTDANLLAMLKHSVRVLTQHPQLNLLPNVALLRAQGVPDDNIAKLLIAHPLAFLKPTSRFSEIVEEVKKLQFDPQQYMFLEAVRALACLSRSSLEAKFDVYRKWGLSKDEVQLMFRKHPYSLMISEKNYFVNEMGCTPSFIAKQPCVMTYSLTRRIIPRCSVFQILKMKGLVRDTHSLITLLALTESAFLKNYIIKFEQDVPEVSTAYQGKQK